MKNPYDGGFKDLAGDHPELLLRLLGILQPGKKTQITHVPRELQLNAVQIDHGYMIEDEFGNRIELLEAITSWNAKKAGSIALYAFLLWQKYKIPVHCHVLFMAEKYAPAESSDRLVYETDFGLTIEMLYSCHRLWEIDPTICFEKGSEPLLAWAPLLKGGSGTIERAAAAIEQLFDLDDHEKFKPIALVSKLASLASLRYDKNAIRKFLERLEKKIMMSTDAFKVSWLYQEGLEEGRAEGKAEGKAEGEARGIAKGKSDAIRLALQNKFPALGPILELDQVERPEVLDSLLLAVLEARNPAEAHSAVLVAANQRNIS